MLLKRILNCRLGFTASGNPSTVGQMLGFALFAYISFSGGPALLVRKEKGCSLKCWAADVAVWE